MVAVTDLDREIARTPAHPSAPEKSIEITVGRLPAILANFLRNSLSKEFCGRVWVRGKPAALEVTGTAARLCGRLAGKPFMEV